MRFLPLCVALALLTGCAEVYLDDADDYVVPHIVSIDPPLQEFHGKKEKRMASTLSNNTEARFRSPLSICRAASPTPSRSPSRRPQRM